MSLVFNGKLETRKTLRKVRPGYSRATTDYEGNKYIFSR